MPDDIPQEISFDDNDNAGDSADSSTAAATSPQETNFDDGDFPDDEEFFAEDQFSLPKENLFRLDIDSMNIFEDFQSFIKSPFSLLVAAIAILTFLLFTLMFIEHNIENEYIRLKGYVMTNFTVPDWYKKDGELPAEIQELIEEHHRKQAEMKEELKLEKDDPRAEEIFMGDYYPQKLHDDDFYLILEAQGVGPITSDGVKETERMNLSGLDMRDLSFRYVNKFIQTNLRYANFSGIKVRGLVFRGASLGFANFSNSYLKDANFVRARYSDSNFSNIILENTSLYGSFGQRVKFTGAQLAETKMNDSIFKLSDFSNANLRNIDGRYSHFEACNFAGANLHDAVFRYSNLTGASFVGADLRNVDFREAKLEGANFEGANLEGTNFKDADISFANFKNVKNLTEKQIKESPFYINAVNLLDQITEKKNSWAERF